MIALTFDTKTKAASRYSALTPKPAMMFKADSSGGKSAGQASEITRFRIEPALANKCDGHMKVWRTEESEGAADITSSRGMPKLQINEIDFDTKIKMLVKAFLADKSSLRSLLYNQAFQASMFALVTQSQVLLKCQLKCLMDRVGSLEDELRPFCRCSPEETERIKEIVQDGFSKDEEESYY
ncbi:uncharacterized protein AKAME5_002244800 [Lates japonicus]|uniref:Uncharacterized protein n=1 Tax=Lates japonicus TaxID=270547 RepID=A0AAD3NAX0_LATJO|nr:uncharacterized protein AKAME5_002244800 [Lates japonicus]